MAKKAKAKRAEPTEWVQVWNELKRAEGGAGADIIGSMKCDGIRARTCHSVYVGHIGVEVPANQVKKAERWLNKNW